MNWAKILGRWTMRSIHGAILAAALLGSASVVSAQLPAATAPAAQKHYTKSLSFDLPIRMDPAFRAELTEVRLYVKAPGAAWKLQDQGSPQQTKFQCRVAQDGEYWYTLVTVDRAGQANPPNVELEAPSQRVVVDTGAPIVQVQAGNTQDGDLCLRCNIMDANPDHATLRAVCRTELGDIPLEIAPNLPGCFKVKGPEMLRYPVLVSVKDMAGNVGMKEVNLRDLIGTTAGGPTTPTTPATPTQTTPMRTGNDIALTTSRPDLKGVPPQPINSGELPMPKTDVNPAPRVETPGPIGSTNRLDFPPPPVSQPIQPTPVAVEPTNKLPTVPVETVSQRPSGAQQLINTTHASLEYRIDQVGPSGVGKVDVFMTPDNGQSWHRLGEDSDKNSPAQINLPGDGVYGIRIAVSNGNGFGGKTPVRGDSPQCTIEVDTTSPFVQLRSAEVHPSLAHVEIRWNATDKNLGTEPVTLSYRSRVDGPWQVIAKNVKNDGMYRWAVPRDAGGQFFFKIEVADQAGNVSQDISRTPVVIDMSEPRATVVGVSGSATPRPGPSIGNGN